MISRGKAHTKSLYVPILAVETCLLWNEDGYAYITGPAIDVTYMP